MRRMPLERFARGMTMGRKRKDAADAERLAPGLYLDGRTYLVKFMVAGKWVRERCGTDKRHAMARLKALRDDAERGILGLSRIQKHTMTDLWTKYEPWAKAKKKSADRDVRTWNHSIKPTFGDLLLTQVDRRAVEAFLRKRQADDGISVATCNRELALLKGMLSRAVEFGMLDRNHLHGIKGDVEDNERTPNLTLDDERRLLAACATYGDADPIDPTRRASPPKNPARRTSTHPRKVVQPWLLELVTMALGTGARLGELVNLRWCDLSWKDGTMALAGTKNGSTRTVPIPPVALASLQARCGIGTGKVFLMADGTPLTGAIVTGAFQRVSRRLNLVGGDAEHKTFLRFHDLRHVAAGRFLSAGASIIQLMDLLGHRSMHLARRYAKSSNSDLRRIVDTAAQPAVEQAGSADHQ